MSETQSAQDNHKPAGEVPEIEPLQDFVVLRALHPGETPGGLRLPAGVDGPGLSRLVVVAVGPGYEHPETGRLVRTVLQVGDVVFGCYTRDPLLWKAGGERFALCRECDIMARQPASDTTETE